MSDVPRPGTTASVDSRVERLEGQVASLSTDVALIKQAQGNLTALVTTQHTSIVTQLTAITSDLRSFMQSAGAQSAEPAATPAGRAILDALRKRDEERDVEHREIRDDIAETKRTADAALRWTMRASAVIGAGMAVLTIFAPYIRGILGLHS